MLGLGRAPAAVPGTGRKRLRFWDAKPDVLRRDGGPGSCLPRRTWTPAALEVCGLRPPRAPFGRSTSPYTPGMGAKCPSPPPPHPGALTLQGSLASGPQGPARCLTPTLCTPFTYLSRTLRSEVSFPCFSPAQSCWRAREIRLALISRLLHKARALRGHPSDPTGFPGSSPHPLPPNGGTPLIGLVSVGTSKQKRSVLFFALYSVTQSQGLESEGGKKRSF